MAGKGSLGVCVGWRGAEFKELVANKEIDLRGLSRLGVGYVPVCTTVCCTVLQCTVE